VAEQFARKHFGWKNSCILGRGVHYAHAREGALSSKNLPMAHAAQGYHRRRIETRTECTGGDEKVPGGGAGNLRSGDPDSVIATGRTLGGDERSQIAAPPIGRL